MRFTFIFCGLSVLLACNSSDKKTNETTRDSSGVETTVPPISSINPVKLSPSEISTLNFNGKLEEAWKWTDSLGDNIFILSSEAPFNYDHRDEFGEDGLTATLFATHFSKKDAGYKQVFAVSDGIKGCEFDVTSNFIPGSATITDLDNNGLAEIKFQYMVACRSDVSPAVYILYLVENGKKHALNGLSWISHSPDFIFDVDENNVNLSKLPPGKDEYEILLKTFGRYRNENDFASASPAFVKYARSEWLKYVKEKTGE